MGDTPEGVVFSFYGDISCKATRSIVVKEDMTIEVRKHK